jgi:secondary thiamine-phosphate synthase enzyme
MQFTVSTKQRRQVIDITDQAQTMIPKGVDGVAVVTVLHTTAAVTTADLDPGTDLDLLDFLEAITPAVRWRHPHNPSHAPDHLLASIIGPSVMVPVRDGNLVLGTWQSIILVELDGPRDRQLELSVLAAG